MRKKIVRLTESDLVRLVKKVIKEQEMEQFADIKKDGDLDSRFVLLQGEDAETVSETLSNLPENLRALAITDCEFADFSDVDLCQYAKLVFVNLKGTPNNLEENTDCHYNVTNVLGTDEPSFYEF